MYKYFFYFNMLIILFVNLFLIIIQNTQELRLINLL